MKYLKEIRTARKKSQQDIAKYLGITRQAYCNYENGNRSPDFETLLKIGEYFGVSVDYLLRGDEKSPQAEAQGDQTSEIPEDYAMLNEGNKQFVNEMIARLLAGQSQPAQGPDSQP